MAISETKKEEKSRENTVKALVLNFKLLSLMSSLFTVSSSADFTAFLL